MEQPALKILNSNRIMAISTVRPDGWPQTTVVGYVNRGLDIFFLISRSSQKFANIQNDDRISFAVAPEPAELSELKVVFGAGHAKEISDQSTREAIWKWLIERHANLARFKIPDTSEAVFMRATCEHLSVLDFSQGFGHREQFVITDTGLQEVA